MIRTFLVVFLFAVSARAQTSEKQTVETFFEAFHKRDVDGLKKVMAPQASFHSVSAKKAGNVLSAESLEDFYKSIQSFPLDLKFEEKLTSCNVQSDGKIANVWTGYEFYIDGKLSHKGVNSFQLYHGDDGWRIVHCLDSRVRE